MTLACNSFHNWSNRNKLTLNFNKCKTMSLSHTTGNKNVGKYKTEVKINDYSLEPGSEFKHTSTTLFMRTYALVVTLKP